VNDLLSQGGLDATTEEMLRQNALSMGFFRPNTTERLELRLNITSITEYGDIYLEFN
jgi:hypothetical protein